MFLFACYTVEIVRCTDVVSVTCSVLSAVCYMFCIACYVLTVCVLTVCVSIQQHLVIGRKWNMRKRESLNRSEISAVIRASTQLLHSL
jgi:hypothetical protein